MSNATNMDFNNLDIIIKEIDKFESSGGCGEISSILENYLSFVAKTGDPLLPWNQVKGFLRYKLSSVMGEFHKLFGGEEVVETANTPSFSYAPTRNKILQHFDSFVGAPFTIQRLCEILIDPKRHYKRTDKFLRGLEKNVLVVSFVEPGHSRRVRDQQQSIANGLQDMSPLHTPPPCGASLGGNVHPGESKKEEINSSSETQECDGDISPDMVESITTNGVGDDSSSSSSTSSSSSASSSPTPEEDAQDGTGPPLAKRPRLEAPLQESPHQEAPHQEASHQEAPHQEAVQDAPAQDADSLPQGEAMDVSDAVQERAATPPPLANSPSEADPAPREGDAAPGDGDAAPTENDAAPMEYVSEEVKPLENYLISSPQVSLREPSGPQESECSSPAAAADTSEENDPEGKPQGADTVAGTSEVGSSNNRDSWEVGTAPKESSEGGSPDSAQDSVPSSECDAESENSEPLNESDSEATAASLRRLSSDSPMEGLVEGSSTPKEGSEADSTSFQSGNPACTTSGSPSPPPPVEDDTALPSSTPDSAPQVTEEAAGSPSQTQVISTSRGESDEDGGATHDSVPEAPKEGAGEQEQEGSCSSSNP